MLDQNITPTRDAPTIITRDIGDNTIYAQRVQPYGFLYLSLEDGELPEKYKGAYTSIDAATLAMDLYQEDRKQVLADRKRALNEINSSVSLKKPKRVTL